MSGYIFETRKTKVIQKNDLMQKNYVDNIEIEITFAGYAPPYENGDFDIFEYED